MIKKHLLSAAAIMALSSAISPITAQTVLHSNDFEDQEVGEKDATWKAANVRDYHDYNTIEIDEDDTHGKYVKAFPRGKGKPGVAYYGFGAAQNLNRAPSSTDILAMEESGVVSYTIEFDAAFQCSAYVSIDNGTPRLHGVFGQIGISSPSTVLAKRIDYGFLGSEDNTYENIFFSQQVSSNTSVDDVTENTDNYAADFGFYNDDELTEGLAIPTDGTWAHYKIDVNTSTKAVSVNITPDSGDAITASFTSGATSLWLSGLLFRPTGGSEEDYVAFDNIKITNNTATGIEDVNVETSNTNDAIYTLSGVRVDKPQKGVYIKNGKKFVVK